MTVLSAERSTPQASLPAGSAAAASGPRVRREDLWAVVPFVVLALGWQLVVDAGWLSRGSVASPTDIGRAAGELFATGAFWSTVGHTLVNWLSGLAVSMLIALPLGLVLGSQSVVYRVFRVVIDFLRTIPPIVLLPLFLLLYGASFRTGLLVIVFGSTWPLMIQTMYGVHQVDPLARDVAQAYALRRRDVWARVIVPSAAPFVATGLRIAATMSLTLTIGAELLGGVPGIGSEIAVTQAQYATIPDMYVYIIVATLIGVVLNLLMMRAERGVLSWHAAHRTA